MASRLMHLAIAKKMKECNTINNFARYEIGQILPDAITHDLISHGDSHFKVNVCDGKRKMIDFAEFRSKFEHEIISDDLYLGYYFHLIQDGIHRKFLYYDYEFQVTCREDVEMLHNDYRLLNAYLISKYHLNNHLSVPDGFEKEKINCIYPFSIDLYLEDIKKDFMQYQNGNLKFFTESMVEEYITLCIEICNKEYIKIKKGQSNINPMDYSWELLTKRAT